MIKELVQKNRSYRRFHEEVRVRDGTLRGLVDLARLSASSANLQPLKYVVSTRRSTNEKIFPHLKWAGYLKDWPGPQPGERPAAYIIILGDKTIAEYFGCDHGIAAQSILLGAVEEGLGGCVISNVDRVALKRELSLPECFEILIVIALGTPLETVKVEPVGADGDVRYWRDASGVHHVPKRRLEEIIIKLP